MGTTSSADRSRRCRCPRRRWPPRCASGCGAGACSPWAGRWCRWCRAARPGRPGPTSSAGSGSSLASASSQPSTLPPASGGSGWRVSSQSCQAAGGAQAPVAAASKASVNWVTIRCARRCCAGSCVAGTRDLGGDVAGGDRHLGVRIHDVVLELLGPVHRVDRHHHRVGAQDGEMRDHQLRAVLHVQQHPVALAHAQRMQPRRQALGHAQQLGVAEDAVEEDQRRLVRVAAGADRQVVPQRGLRRR